jgi:hypothetical protein
MVHRPGANSPEPGSTTRATASSAPRPRTQSSPLRRPHAVPTLTMRLPAPEYLASLVRFERIRSRPLEPQRSACTAGQAGVGWRSIGRSPTAISVKNTAVFFRAVARDRHATSAWTAASHTLRGYETRSGPRYGLAVGLAVAGAAGFVVGAGAAGFVPVVDGLS